VEEEIVWKVAGTFEKSWNHVERNISSSGRNYARPFFSFWKNPLGCCFFFFFTFSKWNKL
jgi:hypothetical protein